MHVHAPASTTCSNKRSEPPLTWHASQGACIDEFILAAGADLQATGIDHGWRRWRAAGACPELHQGGQIVGSLMGLAKGM